MLEQRITLINKLGLHARATAKLINVTTQFSSKIMMGRSPDRLVDAKSIMSVMLLAASKGTELYFQIEGNDETEAWQAIEEIILQRFGEEE
ncbi:HPr family phosphocarrier protein [Balneatrix alpica]|uniref:HPr family phosphocarrier protein n=1 Tax=Balneatrix alpica TaxID=75684 RepID=A0ABV5Z8Z6_9GAMM|nr:HPr family phosphocarrier protein [Balneatrix alpica]